jgi:hypothetical protein
MFGNVRLSAGKIAAGKIRGRQASALRGGATSSSRFK